MVKLRVISRPWMVIYFIKHPHGVNPRDFLRVMGMFLHALDTISTYVDSCLGQKSNIVLILRINFSPDGRTRWTGFLENPHIGLLGHEKSQIFTATANIDHAKRELVPNLRSNGSYMCKK